MHDVLEGSANNSMANITHDLIYVQEKFSLEHLQKKKLKMSSAEVLCFTRYFGLLVSDKVERDNEIWMLYISLRKIISILTSPSLVRGHIVQLDELVK